MRFLQPILPIALCEDAHTGMAHFTCVDGHTVLITALFSA